MSGWAWAMVAGFAFGAILNRDNRRALWWVIALGVTFVAGVLWFDYGLPYHAAFAGFCDIALGLAIYATWKNQWENALLNVVRFALLVNIIANFSILTDNALHGAILEACNWVALIIISGPKILEAINALLRPDSRSSSWVRSINCIASAPRKTAPWWKHPERKA